ncbi:MAG: IclR family transcriptional regulator [Deltaproteobacteria bacterium]|nr:IclR family transcriptional regulator [Deltaproteobacteria bacterium]
MYQAPLIKKVFKVIDTLVEEGNDLRLSYIVKKTGINKGTLYGILSAMEREGYVKKDKERKTYSISTRLVDLAKRILKKADLPGIARPFLERLSQKFDETVFLGVRDGDHITILDVVEPAKVYKISSPPGTKLPITAGATGKVVLSFLTDDEIKSIIKKKGLKRYTEKSILDEKEFLEELRRVRESKYSIEFEEYMKGVWACAAPVFSNGKPLAFVWIVGFTSLLREERVPEIIEEVKDTVHLVSLAYESFWRKEEKSYG